MLITCEKTNKQANTKTKTNKQGYKTYKHIFLSEKAVHTDNYLEMALDSVSCCIWCSISYVVFSPCEVASILSASCTWVNAHIICDSDSWEKDLRPFLFRRLLDVMRTVCNLGRLNICFFFFNWKQKKKASCFVTRCSFYLNHLFSELKTFY